MARTPCVLGCPDTRVLVLDHCGGRTICDITDNVTFLRWGRELDDDSEVEITLHIEGDSQGRGCCECLEKMRTYRNEIMIVRGDEVVWGPGPLVTIQIQRHIAHLVARDIVAWLDVRLVHNTYQFVQADLGTIAQTVIEDALTMGPAAAMDPSIRDACILDYATFGQTGILTDMDITANQRTAGEVLRDLASQGLDFTVIRRSLIIGSDFAFGPVGPLRDEDFQEDLEISERGLAAATMWYVSGGMDLTGTCGGPDPFYGLIERGVEGFGNDATTQEELNRLACNRLAASNPPPFIVNVPSEGFISQNAPICPEVMVPGTLIDLDIRELCRAAYVRQRLTAVSFVLDDKGERASITLAPLGPLQLDQETG